MRTSAAPAAEPPRSRLRLGRPGDVFEREADRVAEAITTDSGSRGLASAVARTPPPHIVQRLCPQCQEEQAGGALQRRCAACAAEEERLQAKPAAPAAGGPGRTVPEATAARIARMRGGGVPLSPGLRSYFEPRLGRDLASVHLHTGAEAEAAAREVRARAFTVGSDIAFAPGELQPESAEGRRLLAHELVHTVQQGTGAPAWLARQEEGGTSGTTAPPPSRPRRPPSLWKAEQQCDRDSRENTDFPNTHITTVHIDLGNLTTGMTLTWNNPTGLALPTGGFPFSPGAGLCCNDCNDVTVSNTPETLCTPKGTHRVYSKGCVLSSRHPEARNPTYFDESRSAIAIHKGRLPGVPASHGCVRTTEEVSEIIHDNSVYGRSFRADPEQGLPDRRTTVEVTGTWRGSGCYRSASDRDRVPRSTACPATPGPEGASTSAPEGGAAAPATGSSEAGPSEESQ